MISLLQLSCSRFVIEILKVSRVCVCTSQQREIEDQILCNVISLLFVVTSETCILTNVIEMRNDVVVSSQKERERGVHSNSGQQQTREID